MSRNRNIHSTCKHCFIHATNILNSYHLPRAVLGTLNKSNRNPWIYILVVGECQQVINRINSTFMTCNKVMDTVKLEYGKNEHICHTKTCKWMFMAALFIIANTLEMTQMSINYWKDKQKEIYTYNGILFSNRKEIITDTCYNIDETQEHHTS